METTKLIMTEMSKPLQGLEKLFGLESNRSIVKWSVELVSPGRPYASCFQRSAFRAQRSERNEL